MKNSAGITISQYGPYWHPSGAIGTLPGMAEKRDKSANMTPADKAAAKRLMAIWNAKHRGLDLTQQRAGQLLGDISQGAVGHYLHGRMPLGLGAVQKFAGLLGVDPRSIRDDLPGMDLAMSQSMRGHAGMIASRREALSLSVQDIHQRLLQHAWPASYQPPTLETVGHWFSGTERPYDMHYLQALYAALELDLDDAMTAEPREARTALSQALLTRIEAMTVEEQERWLAFTAGAKPP